MSESIAVAENRLYFTRSFADDLAKQAVPRGLHKILSRYNSFGKVLLERGSFEQLESTDRLERGQYQWDLQRAEETDCVISASGEDIMAYNESRVHLWFEEAERQLPDWLSNPKLLAEAGPAAVHQLLSHMGLEYPTDIGV
ncbi:hypothetical protein QFC20_006106 [Naganishia adeliensis]|uniref:Uncharacterized protein n=1 Tax=Naganishia adeliensis TaxID=92952 RepID=A0ACC2VEV2_9TREE|nr:hypothetical protein QFC20_006106 [Naganishia adeliensis]